MYKNLRWKLLAHRRRHGAWPSWSSCRRPRRSSSVSTSRAASTRPRGQDRRRAAGRDRDDRRAVQSGAEGREHRRHGDAVDQPDAVRDRRRAAGERPAVPDARRPAVGDGVRSRSRRGGVVHVHDEAEHRRAAPRRGRDAGDSDDRAARQRARRLRAGRRAVRHDRRPDHRRSCPACRTSRAPRTSSATPRSSS